MPAKVGASVDTAAAPGCPFHPGATPAAACLVRRQFARAANFKASPAWLPPVVRGVLKLRARPKAVVSIERYPMLLADKPQRTHAQGLPAIESIRPASLAAMDARRAEREASGGVSVR